MSKATDELIRLSQSRARERGISFGEALVQIARENPLLASEHRAQVLKVQTDYITPPEKKEAVFGPAQTEFIQLANERVKRDGITLSEAIRSIGRERPSLADEYRNEIIHGKV
jgi:CO/xanthine dehydrogenase FAD-binding subunit